MQQAPAGRLRPSARTARSYASPPAPDLACLQIGTLTTPTTGLGLQAGVRYRVVVWNCGNVYFHPLACTASAPSSPGTFGKCC